MLEKFHTQRAAAEAEAAIGLLHGGDGGGGGGSGGDDDGFPCLLHSLNWWSFQR